MEVKSVVMSTRPTRMAADLLWFAGASLAAGLLAAIGIGALAMLLAQPAYADDAAAGFTRPTNQGIEATPGAEGREA